MQIHVPGSASVGKIRYHVDPLPRSASGQGLTFTGRIVGAEEAVKLGVVADPVAEALALAKEIAKKSPQAIRPIKKLVNAAPSLDVRAAFALETDEQLLLLGSPNQMEAAMAVMQTREPSFEDPTS